MTIGYSLVRSGDTPMKHRFGLILALGHYPNPVLHRAFVDRQQCFSNLSPVDYLLPQFSAYHQWFLDGPQITSY
ncbi:hypothetical protein HAX54_048883, partial [Datura stramonium]|nr:hypothetical protein [Datura stramonium]